MKEVPIDIEFEGTVETIQYFNNSLFAGDFSGKISQLTIDSGNVAIHSDKKVSTDCISKLVQSTSNLLFSSLEGRIGELDLAKNEISQQVLVKDHQVTSLAMLHENVFLNGQEDGFLKLWDFRQSN